MQKQKSLTNEQLLRLESKMAQEKINKIKKILACEPETRIPVVAQTEAETVEIN